MLHLASAIPPNEKIKVKFFKSFKFNTMKVWSSIVLFCLMLLPFFSECGSPLRVEVSAKGAILINAETGAVLWEKNAYTPMYPSSTTKLFTAAYALEKKGNALDETVTVSHDAVHSVAPNVRRAANGQHPPYRLEYGGTHMSLKAGEILPFRVLLYGLMLSSGNDAANAIAQHVSGTVPSFMEEMNQYLKKKGCLNTTLNNPHGLPHDEHKTTAYDMALLAREAMKIPLFREVVKTTHYPRPATNKQPESMLHQHNALVKPGRFYYPKATGIKTGYTISGGYSLVCSAEDPQRKLIAVLLGCEKIEQRYKDAIALFEAGFNEKKVSRTLFSKGFDVFTHPIDGAKAPLQAYLLEDIILKYYSSEEPEFKTKLIWQISALPISLGQKVGEIQVITPKGRVLSSAPVFAVKNVEATFKHQAQLAFAKVKKGLWDHVTLVMSMIGITVLASTFYYSHRPLKKKRSKSHKMK